MSSTPWIHHDTTEVVETQRIIDYINETLKDDKDVKSSLPLRNASDLYKAVESGLILAKIINIAKPGQIDFTSLNHPGFASGDKLSVYKAGENLNKCIQAASDIGVVVTNIGSTDFLDVEKNSTQHMVLGLLWQLIRIGLLNKVSVARHPDLVYLRGSGENLSTFVALSAEELLKRWINHELREKNATFPSVTNFGEDLQDCRVYAFLLENLNPDRCNGVLHTINSETDKVKKAKKLISAASQIGCGSIASPTDIVTGNMQANLAFTAALFNALYQNGDDHESSSILRTMSDGVPISEEGLLEENLALRDEIQSFERLVESQNELIEFFENKEKALNASGGPEGMIKRLQDENAALAAAAAQAQQVTISAMDASSDVEELRAEFRQRVQKLQMDLADKEEKLATSEALRLQLETKNELNEKTLERLRLQHNSSGQQQLAIQRNTNITVVGDSDAVSLKQDLKFATEEIERLKMKLTSEQTAREQANQDSQNTKSRLNSLVMKMDALERQLQESAQQAKDLRKSEDKLQRELDRLLSFQTSSSNPQLDPKRLAKALRERDAQVMQLTEQLHSFQIQIQNSSSMSSSSDHAKQTMLSEKMDALEDKLRASRDQANKLRQSEDDLRARLDRLLAMSANNNNKIDIHKMEASMHQTHVELEEAKLTIKDLRSTIFTLEGQLKDANFKIGGHDRISTMSQQREVEIKTLKEEVFELERKLKNGERNAKMMQQIRQRDDRIKNLEYQLSISSGSSMSDLQAEIARLNREVKSRDIQLEGILLERKFLSQQNQRQTGGRSTRSVDTNIRRYSAHDYSYHGGSSSSNNSTSVKSSRSSTSSSSRLHKNNSKPHHHQSLRKLESQLQNCWGGIDYYRGQLHHSDELCHHMEHRPHTPMVETKYTSTSTSNGYGSSGNHSSSARYTTQVPSTSGSKTSAQNVVLSSVEQVRSPNGLHNIGGSSSTIVASSVHHTVVKRVVQQSESTTTREEFDEDDDEMLA